TFSIFRAPAAPRNSRKLISIVCWTTRCNCSSRNCVAAKSKSFAVTEITCRRCTATQLSSTSFHESDSERARFDRQRQWPHRAGHEERRRRSVDRRSFFFRSEEHTSELQSRQYL